MTNSNLVACTTGHFPRDRTSERHGRFRFLTARILAVGQREYPEHRTAFRIFDLSRELRHRAQDIRPASGGNGDVLLAIDAVADREGIDDIVGANLPQHLTGGIVERLDIAPEIAREYDAAAGRQHRAGRGRPLTVRPDRSAVGKP